MGVLGGWAAAALRSGWAWSHGGRVELQASGIGGDTRNVTARVYLPATAPPHPVVIDLHGCSGIVPARNRFWSGQLTAWGYAVMKVDSFTRRGRSDICNDVMAIPPSRRLDDVRAAIRHIQGSAKLDAGNLFLMGMSHGATTVLLAHRRSSPVFAGLKGIVAFYPYCTPGLPPPAADTLVLIGALDDWTPARQCRQMAAEYGSGRNFQLVVYPGAYHSFDVPGVNGVYYGHKLVYDEAATQDSLARVRRFLQARTGRQR